jgi:hypothetical protein
MQLTNIFIYDTEIFIMFKYNYIKQVILPTNSYMNDNDISSNFLMRQIIGVSIY